MSNRITDDYIEDDEGDEYARIIIDKDEDLFSPLIYEEYSDEEDDEGDEYARIIIDKDEDLFSPLIYEEYSDEEDEDEYYISSLVL